MYYRVYRFPKLVRLVLVSSLSLFPLKCLVWTKEMTSVPVYTAVYAYRRVSLFSAWAEGRARQATYMYSILMNRTIGVERQYLFKNGSLKISF